MKRLLSIDFDYFIDTNLDTRNTKFPDGVDDKPQEELNREWEYFYNTYPEIKEIGVTEEFNTVCKALRWWLPTETSNGAVKCFIALSHKDIKKVFNDDPTVSEDFLVTHIDFHHDCYISGGNTLDCANWVRILKDRRPNSEVNWIRREDSEMTSLFGEYPYPSTTELKFESEYDYIFICLSPEWTPPHLNQMFEFMCAQAVRFEVIKTF